METASFRLYSKVNKALKIQILACVDDIYTRALKAKYVAYGNLSLLEVITHLKSNYYNITPADLKDNPACMKYVYNINQPFETVITYIENSVDFTDSGRSPFTPNQVATTNYELIFSTTYFTNSC